MHEWNVEVSVNHRILIHLSAIILVNQLHAHITDFHIRRAYNHLMPLLR